MAPLALLFAVGAGGIVLATARLLPPRLVPPALVLGATPMFALAIDLVATGVVSALTGWVVYAVALLVFAWSLVAHRRVPSDLFFRVLAISQFVRGVSFVVAASGYQNPQLYGEFGTQLWLWAPSYMIAGIGMWAGRDRPADHRFGVFSILAAVNMLALAMVFSSTKVWTGAVNLSLLAVLLLATLPRRHDLRSAAAVVAAIGVAIALVDLAQWIGSALAILGPPDWSAMRPDLALGLACVGGAVVLLRVDHDRWRGPAVALAFLAIAVGGVATLTVIGSASGLGPGGAALLGLLRAGASSVSPGAGLLVAAVGAITFLDALGITKRVVSYAYVIVGAYTAAMAVLNIIAFVLGSSFLLDSFGFFGLYLHSALALVAVAGAMLSMGFEDLLRRPILERVGASILALTVLLLTCLRILGTVGPDAVRLARSDLAAAESLVAAWAAARNTAFLLVVFGMFALGVALARTVSRPLADLVDALEEAGRGRRAVRVPMWSHDEIGVAAQSFNRMNEQIATATAALEASEARFRTVIEKASIGIAIARGLHIMYANPKFAEMLGYSTEELTGRAIGDLVAPSERAAFLARAAANEEAVERQTTYEILGLRRDGSEVPALAATARVTLADGPATVGFFQDITERRRTEEQLKRAIRELERTSAALGAALERSAEQQREAETLAAAAWTVAIAAADDRLLDAMLETVSGLVQSDAVAVFRPEGAEWLECVGSVGDAKIVETRLPLVGSIVGRCVTTKRPEVVNDARSDAEYARLWAEERSLVHVPLLMPDRLVGVLVAMGSKVDQFSAADVRRLAALAPYVAAALRMTDQLHELRDERGRMQLILEQVPIMLYALDGQGVFTLSEGSGLAALGLRPGQVVGSSAFELFKDVPESLEPIRSALAGKAMRSAVAGRGWVFDATHIPVRDAGGRVTGVVGVAVDVTAQERASAQLRLLQSAVENAAEAVVITDAMVERPGPHIVYVNPAYEQMSGRSAAELIGKSPRIVQGPGTDRAVTAQMRQAFSEGREFLGENLNYRRDGTPYQVEIHVTPIRDARGTVTNFVSVQRDVTQRRALETQLAHAQRLDSIGQLAGGIAHDFNNLLAVILNYAHFAARESRDSAVGRDIGEIVNAAERAAVLTRQLLTFSRREVVRAEVLDLTAVVRDTEALLTRTLGEHIEIRVTADPAGSTVRVDRGHFEQVLMNLAVNARDAMPRGGVLTLETARVDLDEHEAARHVGLRRGPHVRLRVTDSGVGMPPDIVERAFEPFFTTKARGVGTGLGLSIVHGIVTGAGGSIELRSRQTEPERGTVVEIHLPAADEAAGAATTPRHVVSASRGSETVLIVEDDPSVLRLAERILAGAGYRTLVAAGPAEARAFSASDEPIHLLLSDVVMPQRSGPELAAEIVALRPGLKLLFMSGYPEKQVTARGDLDFAAAFLAKPFTDTTLLRSVREVLDG